VSWTVVRTVAARDVRAALTNRGVMVPLILVPVVLLVGIPLLFGIVAVDPGAGARGFAPLVEAAPEAVAAVLAAHPEDHRWLVFGLVYLTAPLYLFVPVMVASVIAADSFAGEKERGTIEALLHTPTTDAELFAGKALGAVVPAVVVSLGGAVAYGLVADWVASITIGASLFPNLLWTVLALWVAPAIAVLGLGTMVVVSSRVSTFQAAAQTGGLIALPLVALVIGQFGGAILLATRELLLVGAVLFVVDAAIVTLGARTFSRDRVLSRL
jgi:ABC-2 type transport system permease protein